jgi:hemoglobin
MTERGGPRADIPRTDDGSRAHLPDIAGRDDIAALLTDFYGRAFDDELLGPIFVEVARMSLAEHLPVMCDFWQTVLFRSGQYRGNALQPHLRLNRKVRLTAAHFDRWLTLWHTTVDDRHAGAKADLAKLQATRIAGAMCRRIAGRPSGRVQWAGPVGGSSGRVQWAGPAVARPRRSSA